MPLMCNTVAGVDGLELLVLGRKNMLSTLTTKARQLFSEASNLDEKISTKYVIVYLSILRTYDAYQI